MIHTRKERIPLTGTVKIYHQRYAEVDGVTGESKIEEYGLEKEKDVSELRCLYPDCRERARIYITFYIDKSDVFTEADGGYIGVKRIYVCEKHSRDRFVRQLTPQVNIVQRD